MTVIKRDKEIDVAAGDIRMVILIQMKGAEELLWPAIRLQPTDTSITGILGGWDLPV